MEKNIMEALKTFVGRIFGTAMFLTFSILGLLGLLSLPLNMLVAIRWYGFEWWSALILVLFLGCVPVIGQIGFVVGTVLGAYYLVQADFDWRKATESRTAAMSETTFNVAKLSPIDFEKYKTTVLKPHYEKACVKQGKAARGLPTVRVQVDISEWCQCTTRVMFDTMSQREMVEKAPPPEVANRVSNAVYAQCGEAPFSVPAGQP
jgi:hypothetical protein